MARPITDDWEDRQVDPQAPEVPHGIREAVQARLQPGDTFWRCPRSSAAQGPLGLFGIGRREVVIEWWLIDADGQLIETFWEE